MGICQNARYKKVIIVAHPDHAPRCAAVAKKLGFRTVIADTREVLYDPESVQEWTRSSDFFVNVYEPKAMEHYRRLGYIE